MDIYGALLSERKQELMTYYYDEDYSLSEISEITGISRQGIRDSVKKSESELRELEDKLHLAERIRTLNQSLDKLTEAIEQIAAEAADDSTKEALKNVLHSLKQIIF